MKLSHFVTIGIVVSILIGIVVCLGVYFFVYKKVIKPAQTRGVVNTTMETFKKAKQASADEESLNATGQDAEATILEVHDAGFTTKRYTQLILVLDVMPANGQAFQVKTTKMISQSHAFLFQPGAKLKVKYDPAHHDQIALVSSPVPASVGPKNSSQRLEELDKLKKKGLINEDEYKRKRQEILNSL
ncbi:MAG: SHOCT domain-containing protein [Desulfatiglandaceae bacterium]|jgi:hypothetical protein